MNEDSGFDSQQEEIFVFSAASRPALGPTQPRYHWILGALSLGEKQPRTESDLSPPSGAEYKNA
jgi:hypothetical protein